MRCRAGYHGLKEYLTAVNKIKKWIVKFAIKRVAKVEGVKKMLDKIKKYLEGKKSISVIVAMMLVGAIDAYLQANHGYTVPKEIWVLLLGLLGITYKVGNNRVEKSTKELIDSVKEQNKLLKEKR